MSNQKVAPSIATKDSRYSKKNTLYFDDFGICEPCRIHEEFDKDNDYQGIQKIMTSLRQHNYDRDDVEVLLSDIKTLFFSENIIGICYSPF